MIKHVCVVAVFAWASLAALGQSPVALHQHVPGDALWTLLPAMPVEQTASEPWVRPERFKTAKLHFAGMMVTLDTAPLEDSPAASHPLLLTLPTPHGDFVRFRVVESPIVEPGLAAVLPGVKTFVGQGIDDPASTVRLDYTPLGFHAQVLGPILNFSIDPYSKNNTDFYAIYAHADAVRRDDWSCLQRDDAPNDIPNGFSSRATGATKRTYRLAVAATASFCSFYGGAPQAQAGIVTLVNRINQVWENEFALRMNLVANNINLMFTNPATQPYTDGNLSAMLNENQTTITSIIGSANYDVGHVVSAGNLGGLAQRPCVCQANSKARGGTGVGSPTGDYMAIQYMSHELGHQFNASHSFNAGDASTCESNRSGSNAYEPGSGSTIMSYTGLCGGANNLQSTSDAMFNQGAYAQVASYIAGTGNCSANVATGNTAPTVNAGPDFSIPFGTAFTAVGSATDPNADSLTYSWEQRDLGAAQPAIGAGSADNGTSPLFRVLPPSSSPNRTFPRIEDVLDGSLTIGEQYPILARTLDLRLTVRDNRAGFGGVNTDDAVYTVTTAAGPFAVTFPNTGVTISGTQTITWNVANTNLAPVSCANVKITLSTDGGASFPHILAASTPNDGNESVTLPDVPSGTARIKIEALGNVFFDVSNSAFNIGCAADDPPASISASDASCDAVHLSWSPVPGITQYRVSRAPANSTLQSVVIATVSATSHIDPTAVPGTTYWYWVRAYDGCVTGDFGASDTGAVPAAPVITTHPAPSTLAPGQTADFVVIAAAASAYQWRRNGTNLSDAGRVSGSGTSHLTITSVESADAATYDCVVSATCSSVTSAGAALNVSAACVADYDDGSATGTPDNGVTIDDLLYYLSIFEAGDVAADVDDGSGNNNHDGGVTIDDLIYYLVRFEAGC